MDSHSDAEARMKAHGNAANRSEVSCRSIRDSGCWNGTAQALARDWSGGDSRANIVVVVGEGLRSDEFSSLATILQTPNMDRIGREGCTFQNGFVVNALCLPSRATFSDRHSTRTPLALYRTSREASGAIQLITDLLHEAGL